MFASMIHFMIRMTVRTFYDQSPRKYGAGMGSNSRPLDHQSYSLQIVLQGPALIALLSAEGSGEPAQMHRFARAFTQTLSLAVDEDANQNLFNPLPLRCLLTLLQTEKTLIRQLL